MKQQMIMPQEVEVFYVIPAIRREMAIAMKSFGMKQKGIAKLLHVKESTISQYINDKRATEVKFNQSIKKAVAESVGKINDRMSLIGEMQKILKLAKSDNVLCEIHKAVSDVPKECDVCFLAKAPVLKTGAVSSISK